MFTPGQFLYLDQQDVIDADGLNMPRAIERVERAVSLMHSGDVVDPPKSVLRWSDDPEMEAVRGRVNFLSAYLGGDINALGMKWVGSYPTNRASGLPRATALIILNDPATGFPIAVMEGSVISAMRTGAISGIAAKYLARRDSAVVGIIGTGVQARTQLLALSSVLPAVTDVRVYNRTPANAQRFVGEMERRIGRPISIVDSPEAAVRGADVALVATTANDPLMRGAWLAPGMLTIQFSGDECDHAVIHGADKVVCDDWETVKHRGITTPAVMHALGLFADSDVHANLGELVNGAKPGRESADERIHFAAIGMGISDVALASMVYESAVAKGLGKTFKLWEREPLWV